VRGVLIVGGSCWAPPPGRSWPLEATNDVVRVLRAHLSLLVARQ
jgi:hypothetical protein